MHHYLSDSAVRRLTADKHTGGMIALVPSAEDASRLALPEWEPSDELHCTFAFLGGVYHEGENKEKLIRIVGRLAEELSPIPSVTWAACSFNPTGDEPCATYLVGGAPLDEAHTLVTETLWQVPGLPSQHRPWVPHITIGYGLNVASLSEFGPLTFDRIRVAFEGDDHTDFSLE